MTKLTPVETVGCKVQDAESPLALDHGWFTSYISTFSFCICLSSTYYSYNYYYIILRLIVFLILYILLPFLSHTYCVIIMQYT